LKVIALHVKWPKRIARSDDAKVGEAAILRMSWNIDVSADGPTDAEQEPSRLELGSAT
jgi:hypothetical protein